ncbi:MdtA/MuxA family multidrug efflux RND transporter periplasmic adaptor subunit [Oleiharenicola lentus]|uniref:MdtA/MuxA family multidrug efflux RND transporter periplasmic adaptor subunit n=1 Tax=Oleiharenicola lentus TaxID=2508720 RepID=A0A4Q1CB83_9BACT|nr:MdtA/MuxA family multidrug efflux RND transporter periplasmic adaptor subunit [Oleiharenicola lentus]RXK56162.1 MdtA/MuxA family multidrug efflux RND transporter periplasmic adaptor subunit [Oleiharenicola lentus]
MSDKHPSSRRRWVLYVVIALVIAAGVWHFSSREKPTGNRWGPNPAWAGTSNSPAMPVRVVKAERRNLGIHLKAIGTVTPFNTVTVRSRVDGQLLKVAFDEGQQVEAGQLLAEIDPEPYRIALAQVEGRQQQNIAQLETARADLERFRQLYEKSLVTSQQMEAQQALVRQREGALAADKAAADDARLELTYTRIEAPISGRLGLRRVDAGNLVRANDTNGLVVITQTKPISVMFTVPEVDLAKVLEPMRAGEKLVAEAWDRSEQNLLATGVLTTVDNQIDLATGTVRLKAEFANADERLFPNQFVNVRLRVRTLADAVVIPAAAVQFGSRGTYVFVVNDKNQSTVREITLGPAEGQEQVVLSGLTPGEPVVLEGIDRLREGRNVVIVEDGVAVTPPPGPPPAGKKRKE